MKNNLFSILKVSFINGLGINKIRTMPKQKLLLYGLFFLFIAGNLLFTMFMYAGGLIGFLAKANLEKMMLPVFAFFVYITSIYFNMYTAKNTLFDSKDNDLLLSMPIKPKTILFARILKIFIINLVISLFIFIPAVIVYVRNVGVSFSFYPIIILITLFLPLVPTIISTLIGYLIAFITTKFSIKNLFEIISSIILVFGILYLSMSIEGILSSLVNNVTQVEVVMKYLSYPIYAVNQIILAGNNIYLLYFVLYNILVTLVFVLILSKSYFKIIYNLKKIKVKSNYKMKKLVANTQVMALFKKEIKRYFSSPVYVLNTAFGVILMLIFSIATLFKPDLINSIFDAGVSIKPIEIISMLIIAICALDNTTACSISLEGNNFWLLKSLPVNTKKIFNAKALVNLLVNIPLAIVSIGILAISFKLQLFEILILVLLTIVFAIFTSYFGLIINLLFPRFEFDNDTQVVKQSASTGVGIFASMFIIAIISVIYVNFKIPYYTYATIIIGLFIVVSIVLKIVLNTWGTKKFIQLS